MLLRSLLAVALYTGVSACNTAAVPQSSPTPGAPSSSPYVAVSVGAAEVQSALNVAMKALRSADWLNDPTLTPQEISDAEEQGSTVRFTLKALSHGQERMLRPTVVDGALDSVELGPPGSTAPLRVAPSANNLPGGFTQQSPTDARMTAAAGTALQLLGGADWLGRPLTLVTLDTAMTQVVAGTNTYLAMTVTTGGQTRTASVVMYQDFKGNASLSWARLARVPGS